MEYSQNNSYVQQPYVQQPYVQQPTTFMQQMYYALIVVSSIAAILFTISWISCRKVAGVYRYVRREQQVTLTENQAKVVDELMKDSTLNITLGFLNMRAQVKTSKGENLGTFISEIPLFFNSDITMVDPDTNDPIPSSDGNTWKFNFIKYTGGYPNVTLTMNDKEGQMLKKWIFTVNVGEKKQVQIDMSDHPEWKEKKL